MSPRAFKPATRVCAAVAVGAIAAFTAGAPCGTAAAADPSPTNAQVRAAPANPAPFFSPPLSADPSPSANPARAANSAPAADASAADDIRDIRGPKHIFPLGLLLAWLAAGAVVAVGAYAAWRWSRRPPPPRKLELFEIALQRIEESRSLMQPSSVREFSIAISDIVRGYIEDGFDITATHRTTEEFLHDLLDSSNAALAAHRNLLEEFLSRCDEAKFAGAGLSMAIMESLHRSARSFVIESSKPLPAATLQPVSA